MLMALAMVLAYMPAMAFADESDETADNSPVVENSIEDPSAVKDEPAEETEEPSITEESEESVDDIAAGKETEKSEKDVEPVIDEPSKAVLSEQSAGEEWYLDTDPETEWVWSSEGFEDEGLGQYIYMYDEIDLEYCWQKNGVILEDWEDVDWDEAEYDDEYDEYDYYIYLPIDSVGTYRLIVREKNDPSEGASKEFKVYTTTVQNNLEFRPQFDNDNEATAYPYGVYDSSTYSYINMAKGDLVVPATVSFSDGKTRTVTNVWAFAPEATSITIPAGVKDIDYVGLSSYDDDSWDEAAQKYTVYTTIPGFQIFGTTGSPAQAYANKYGITFRDLAAEAAARAKAEEDARQGTPVSGMPKIKLKKPAAKKTSIKVQWAKLDKKKVKKSKTSRIEIWVSTNSTFPKGQTIERTVSKGKSSVNIKGLAKNTKYFVKVRAIKYVDGKKMVGPWKQKTVKTKKK